MINLTAEERRDLIDYVKGSKSFTYLECVSLEKKRDNIVLAALKAEPVAWQYRYNNQFRLGEWKTVDFEEECNPEPIYEKRPIYTEPSTNSPVIPDGWIPVSERLPEMGEKQCYVLAADFKNHYWPNIPNTQIGVYGDWFSDGNPTWDDGDGNDLHLKEVTHWLPLPVAPSTSANKGGDA